MRDFAGKCIHFNGIQHPTCKAGLNYQEIAGGEEFGMARRLPCFRENPDPQPCAVCHYPTPAEVAVMEAEFAAHTERLRQDMALIGAAHTDEPQSLVFVCQLCPREVRTVATTGPDLLTHLLEAHQVDADAVKTATGRMTGHLDARDWHQTDYAFTLPDGRQLLIKSVRQRRRGAGRAMWQDETPKGRKRGKR